MQNFFEFMGVPLAFTIDEAALRKKYYSNSRDMHPDRFVQDGDERHQWAMEQSTLNNQAYATLMDSDKRMEHLLRLKGLLATDEGQQQESLPQDFLMEMMDINEAIMELQMDFDAQRYEKTLRAVDELENELRKSVQNILETYSESTGTEADLKKVKFFFLKMKYLLRVRKNLFTFASA